MHNTIFSLTFCLSLILFGGAGCPKAPEQTQIPDQAEVQPIEKQTDATVPYDGLDEALEELDLVDTEDGAVSGY